MRETIDSDSQQGWRSITAGILRLGWPTILEQILVMMIGALMTMLIGSIGTVALAATGMVNSLFFFIQAVFAALSTGATVIIARLTGEGDQHGVQQAALQSLILVVYASIAIMAISLFFNEPLLNLFINRQTQPEHYAQGLILFRILLLSLPFLTINIVLAGIYRGVGNMMLPLVVSLMVNIVYLSVGIIMVKVLDMGLAGAAWAAVVARAVGCLIMVIAIYRGRGRISLSRHDGFRLDLTMVRRILHVGLPAAVEQVVMQGGFLALNVIIYSMGELDKVAYPIVMNINSMAFMPGFGLGMASATLIGHSLGEGNVARAEQINRYTAAVGIVMMGLISGTLIALAPQIASLYTTDQEVIALSASCVRVLGLGSPFMALTTILSSTLRTGGDIKFVMYTTILGIWLIRFGMTWVLHRFLSLGVIAAIWMTLADFTLRTGIYAWRIRQGKWKTIRI